MVLGVESSGIADTGNVPVSEFQANCSALLNAVRDTGRELVITEHGHPVARVAPISNGTPDTLLGMAADLIHLPTELDLDEIDLLDPDWNQQWETKWDDRLTPETDSPEASEPSR